MTEPSNDFIDYIKNKDVKEEITYFHLDDLRVALLVQALKKAETKADQIIDKQVVKTYKSANAFKKAIQVVKDTFQ